MLSMPIKQLIKLCTVTLASKVLAEVASPLTNSGGGALAPPQFGCSTYYYCNI